MIDWARIAELRGEMGDEVFAEIARMFAGEIEEVLARLSPALPPGQAEADLHCIKGSALNLGFRQLAAECHRGEHMARAGQAGGIDPRLLDRIYRESRAAFLAGLDPSARAAVRLVD